MKKMAKMEIFCVSLLFLSLFFNADLLLDGFPATGQRIAGDIVDSTIVNAKQSMHAYEIELPKMTPTPTPYFAPVVTPAAGTVRNAHPFTDGDPSASSDCSTDKGPHPRSIADDRPHADTGIVR